MECIGAKFFSMPKLLLSFNVKTKTIDSKMVSFTSFSPQKFTGAIDDLALKHLLKRTLLGFTIGEFKKFKSRSLTSIIDELVAPNPTPPPPVNFYESVQKDTTGVALGSTWVNATYGDGNINFRRRQSLRAWWLDQMLFQKNSIEEKMILFWHNHFATEISAYDDARYGFKHHSVMRKFALGNFKDFVKAISIDPAMLVYLNGIRNSKTAPDENYARELQELFTIGKGPNSKYTEDDVKSAAKVLTGYRVTRDTQVTTFADGSHDTTDKVFSAFYGGKIIKGRTGQDGQKELDDLLAMIFQQQEVSLFMVRKLYTFFFHYDITEEAETQFIAPLAKIFRDSNYEMIPLLKAMFSSIHFFDPELRGAIIKSPIDHMVGTTRLLEPVWPSKTDALYEYYLFGNDLLGASDRSQQVLGDPPNVAGWPAYYQAPVFHEIWINTTTFPERVKFTESFVKNGYTRSGKTVKVDLMNFIKKLDNPQDPNKLLNELDFWFFQTPISQTLKNQLKTDILLAGQASDYYWTDLWQEFLTKPTTSNTNLVTTRLRSLFVYLLSLPEFQLS